MEFKLLAGLMMLCFGLCLWRLDKNTSEESKVCAATLVFDGEEFIVENYSCD